MRPINLRHALLTVCASAALAACGSNSNNDAPPRTTDVPASAQSSVAGLIAYMNELIATMTNETSEPILVGDATLPVSDSIEPL